MGNIYMRYILGIVHANFPFACDSKRRMFSETMHHGPGKCCCHGKSNVVVTPAYFKEAAAFPFPLG